MKWTLAALILLLIVNLTAYEPHFMIDPAISPDGNTVCFSYMGDLWTVPFEGGTAKRLTATEGADASPAYSPDGRWIAYYSNFEGFPGTYIMPAEGGLAKLVATQFSWVVDWFSDSKSILVVRSVPKQGWANYRVYLDGSRPVEIGGIGNVQSAISKDDKKIIYCQHGEPFREKYRGSINGELWQLDLDTDTYTKLTDTELTERYPAISRQTDDVYFCYSDGEIFQIFKAPMNELSQREQLTHFDTWSARDLMIARDNDRIVYEYFDRIGSYDPATGEAKAIPIEIKEQFHDDFNVHKDVKNRFDEFAVSPDGKLIAFRGYYDLFAMPEKGGEVMQLTHDQAGIDDIVIMNDGTTIYFTSFVKGAPQLFRTSVKTPGEIELVKWSKGKAVDQVEWLPTNQLLVFFSKDEVRSQIAIADSNASKFTTIYDKTVEPQFALSPDERYLLFPTKVEGIWDWVLHMYDLEKKQDYELFQSGSYLYGFNWGLDGKTVFFTKDSNISRLDLVPKDDYYKEDDNWKAILEPEEESSKKNKDDDEDDEKEADEEIVIEFDLNNMRDRIKTIVSRDGENFIVRVDSDSTFYYFNSYDEELTLRKTDYKGKDDKSIHTFESEVNDFNYNKANDVYYLRQDKKLSKFDIKSKKSTPIDNNYKYSWNRHELNRTVFERVWYEFGQGFYDPKMHGVDWNHEFELYAPYVDDALTPDMLSSIVDEMIGDVNASHTGFYPRKDNTFKVMEPATLGLVLDYKDPLKRGIRIDRVFYQGKLYEPFGIRKGDILLSIDGVEIDRDTDIDKLLMDKVGEKIKLMFDTDDGEKEAIIKGLSYWQEYHLAQAQWVEDRRRTTEELTDGRVAYIHVPAMNWRTYQKFMDDLFTQNYDKQALVLDFRGNGGGNTHDSMIEALTRKAYAQSYSRYYGAKQHPAPHNLWEKPIILLIDEGSFSDGEIFPFLFKHLKLGKIVGMPTSGSVIGTGHITFMDGSSMRMPSNGWFSIDGQNMEGNGVQPDIKVEMTPEQIIQDDDVQLKRAIEEILKEI